ncbi:MAG: oligosaccharide flippase family protein [Bacteroidia bacterium]|nr:oligosaccharide flippase family protein [Bacteroidia bacterium]
MDALKKLAGQTAIYGLSTIVARLLNYFLVPLYTYNFTTGEYGIVTELYAYISFLIIVVTYGMETALFNFSVSENDKDKVYSTALISLLVSTLIFVSALSVFAQPLAQLIRHPNHSNYVIWVILIIGLDAFTSIPFAKLREQNKATRFALIKIVNICVNIALNIFFIGICKNAYNNSQSIFYTIAQSIYNPSIGVGYVFISNLVGSFIMLIMLFPEVIRIKYSFDFSLWKRMMAYAFPLLLAGLAGMTNETMDRILLKYLLPPNIAESQVGIYGACYKISILMTIFIQTFRYAAEPFFFSYAREKNAKKLYADVMNYFIIACAFIFVATMLNLSWIQYFIGKEFRLGIHVVPILLLANLCLGVFFNLSIWYKLTGKTRYGAYLTGMGAIITLVLNFTLIPIMGFMGSAWTTLACYATMMVVSYFIGNKHYPVHYNLKRILGYLTLSLALYFTGHYFIQGNSAITIVLNNLLVVLFVIVVIVLERPGIEKLMNNENPNHQ